MRSCYVILTFVLMMFAGTAFGQNTPPNTGTPLLRLKKGFIALSANPPLESRSCVVVNVNGEVYIEKRSHVIIPKSQAHLEVLEGQLTDDQFSNLSALLANPDLAGISDGGLIHPPGDSTNLAWITAEIQRGSSRQEIDYRYWGRYWKSTSTEYDNAPPAYITLQKARLSTLTPLAKWYESLDLSQFHAAEFEPGECMP